MVAATLLAAIIALRMSAKHPGELSALDRGILYLVSPGAGGDVVRRARHHRRGRPLRRADPRARRERQPRAREQTPARRADRDAAARRGERPLPAPAGAARRHARRDHRGPRDRRRCVAVLPRRPGRARPRRRDGPARHAGADAGGRGRAHQQDLRENLRRVAAGRSAVGDRRASSRAPAGAGSCAARPAKTATAAASSTWRAANRRAKGTRW